MKEESRLVRHCIAGHVYDSGPVDYTQDLGARLSFHNAILKMPGAAKLLSLVGKGVTFGLDALFITKFGSHRTDYWRSLCSSVVCLLFTFDLLNLFPFLYTF